MGVVALWLSPRAESRDLAGPPLTPPPIAFLLCWSNVGLIKTQWPCRESGKLRFLGLSFLVLACRVSVPSVACPLSGEKETQRIEGLWG